MMNDNQAAEINGFLHGIAKVNSAFAPYGGYSIECSEIPFNHSVTRSLWDLARQLQRYWAGKLPGIELGNYAQRMVESLPKFIEGVEKGTLQASALQERMGKWFTAGLRWSGLLTEEKEREIGRAILGQFEYYLTHGGIGKELIALDLVHSGSPLWMFPLDGSGDACFLSTGDGLCHLKV